MANEIFDLRQILRGAKKLAADAVMFSRENAPIGWTGQLRQSIGAEQPTIVGDDLNITIYAGVSGKDGKPYAEKQHDMPLRHVSYPPFTLSFADFINKAPKATSRSRGAGPAERKYWAGYRNMRHKAPRFATKYLEAGIEQAVDMGFEKYIGGELGG